MLKTVSSGINTIGALNYKGTWNASTNSPTLTSGVGTKGDYYVVSVAGSTNLDGQTLWGVGDWAVFNGSTWQKVDGGDSGNFVNISVSALTGYMFANGTSNVTASTTIPVANVTGAVPNTVNVLAGTGMTGGGALTGNVTLTLANTAVTAASYGSANTVATFTVNAQGQLTAAGNTTIAIANSAVSGLGTMATQNANAVAITGGSVENITVGSSTPNTGKFTVLTVTTSSSLGNATANQLNNTPIGNNSKSTGGFTDLSCTSGNLSANVIVTNTTAASATFATSSLPLVPAGYIQIQLANATVVKVPYYAS